MSDLNITAGGSYTVNESNSTITIATTEAVTLTGNADTELSEVVITTTADNANLTIDNLNITNASAAIITVGDGTDNTLNITGENVFEIQSGPGACVNVGGGLTVNGTGSFKGTSINASVIGINNTQYKPDSNITIESGTFNLICRSGACAIGGAGARGNAIGNITITGTADITASAPAGHASPIGASYWGDCGDILINGDAKITATSGQHSAAIGGASLTKVGNITINGNATVNAINASIVDDSAAIGSGLGGEVQSLGDIVIGGNAKVTASSNLGLAIDNIEYHRENQEYGTTDEGDYPVVNENTITIGENATFNGTSGDIYTATTINGETFKAAQINYNSTDGLTYSGGSEFNKEDLEATLLEITSGGSYTIAEGSIGKILIDTTDPVTISGGDYSLEEIQIIGQSDNIDLTINDLNITNEGASASIIKFGTGTDNKLTITGNSDFLIKKGYSAGINIGGGGAIGGTGSIKILTLSGAAIGTDGQEDLSTSNIVIESGTFDLETKSGACGLGGAGNGSKIGNITITGTAHVVSRTPQGYGAAIGSAYRGTVGDILINGDATVEATSGVQSAAIGSGVYCNNGEITIGGRASVVANTTSTDVKDAAIGGTYGERIASIGDIKIIEDATVVASSAHGLALDNNRLYVEGKTYLEDYYTVNADSGISISGDTTTSAQSNVILTNGSTTDSVIIGNRGYQGGEIIFRDGNLVMTGNWTSLESGGWGYSSIVQMDYTQNLREDKFANFTLSGGDLKDEDGDGAPDGVGIGSIIYVQKSGAHTNVRNLSGNVVYNGDALGVEGDTSYNIEAVSPIDLSEEFPLPGYYITDPHVTAMRLISDGATISPRGDAGTGSIPADWYSFDNAGGTVTFRDGSYCLYPERQFFSRSYTKVDISNNNQGVQITAGDDLIQKIANLTDGYAITVESGIAVGDKINFETSGNGVIVVKTTANSGKYSLAADSDEWQYQRYTINGGGSFAFDFGDNGSVTGMEDFSGSATIQPAGSEIMTINNRLYQGDKIIFQNGNLALTGNWTSLESGGWGYSSIVQMDYTQNLREDKFANFTLSGGDLKDEDGDGAPDGVGIGSIIYVQKSGAHTNVRNLSGNVVYNGDALGVEGDTSYNIEAVSPIDLSEEFPLPGYYITDPHVTAMRLISDGATISPRGDAGTGSIPADWYSFDNAGGTVTFRDGSYCLYPERQFFSRSYTKVDISNNNQGVQITAGDDLIQKIANLTDGYAITVESGIAVGDKINFETSGNGVIVVKTTANSGKYSLAADSDEWQYQRYTINGGGSFAMVFGDNGSVTGMEDFDGTLTTDDTTLIKGEWVTLESGGFEYTGNATNNPSKSANFTVSGDSITSTDNLSVKHNLYMAAQNGNRIEVAGMSGNASVDSVELGISNDSNYSAHFTETADGIRSNIALMQVSDGASVNNNYSIGIDDSTAQIQFSDGNHVIFTDTYFPTQDFTTINADNGGNGFTLNVDEEKFSTISGLSNGYAMSINAGGNIGDSIAIQSDGGAGVISVQSGSVTGSFNVNGDENFGIKINSGSSIELVNYEGWVSIDGGYKYVSDLANFTISGENFDPSVAKVVSNVKVDNLYRIGLAGLNGNVTINGAETGIINDSDYSIHGAIEGDGATITSAFNISDGASVNGAVTGVLIDDNAKVSFVEGNYRVGTVTNYSSLTFDTINVDNGGENFSLTSTDGEIKNVSGLVDGYSVSITPVNSFSDEIEFTSDGGTGTIALANTTLTASEDEEFAIKVGGTSSIDGLKNFGGTATISGNEDLDRDIGWAIQHKKVALDTDEEYSVATVTNAVGDSLKVYYTNDTTGGVIDFSNETLTNAVLLGQGESSTLIGSQGDDQIMGIATTVNLIGNAGKDTFRGGHYSVNIEDYKEDEDSIYLGSTFNMYYPLMLSSVSGNDLVFTGRAFNPTLTGGSDMVIKNGANMKIKVFDSAGNSAYVGNYWTIADYNAASITALENVKVIDASARTTDVQIIGNALNNTIIGGGSNATFEGGDGDDLIMSEAAFNSTMTGGAGNDTFRGGANLDYVLITDYTEGEDVVYHGRPFADLSINGSIEGDDYTFYVGNKTITVQDGADKVIEVVNVDGETRLFGKYLTLDDNDPATVTAQDGVATIDAALRTEDIVINGNSGDNTIIGGGSNATFEGGDGDDLIMSEAAFNSTMTGGAGNDTFRGGANLDYVLITDYTEGEDVVYHGRPFADLSINGSIEGDDYTFYVGNKTITVQDGADKVIEVVNVDGETRLFGKYLTLDDNDPATVTAQDGVATIDAALRTEDIVINGNSGDNTIISGMGNDTLTGSDGSDLFAYSAGNDVITDYTTDDKISLGAAISNSSLNGSDVVLTVGDDSLTIQNAKGKSLSLIDSSGEEYSTIIGSESPAQVISNLTNIDVDRLNKVPVTNANELSALKNAETSVIELSGNQNADLSKFDNAQVVSLTSGRQTVKFNDKDDNVAVVDENASGQKNIVFGKGKNLGVFNSENANVRVDLSKASNTTIAPYAGTVTLEGYKDSSILIPNVDDIVGAVMENTIDFDRDKIKTDSATVKFDSSADSRLVNLVTKNGDTQKVGFVKGGTLNLGSESEEYLLKGYNDSTITGGAGNDTILAGVGNKIDAGAGNNQIYLTENSESTIVMRSGRATVQNFKAGFDSTSDRLFFGTNDVVDFKFDGANLKVYNNNELRGVLSNVADGADFVNILTADDKSAPKIAVAQEGAIITVEDEIADLYAGKKSGVDFSNYEENLFVNLGSQETNLGTGEVLFYGINQITLGGGQNTLISSSANETLTGNGTTEFIFSKDSGRDLIRNFDFDGDKINVGNETITAVNVNSLGGVRMEIGGSAVLTLENAQGKNFQINNFVAKVDRNITYDAAANYYVATSQNATMTVGEGAEIWLDGSHGKYFSGDIRTLDASTAEGNTSLAGNDLDNTIFAGKGDSTLWGGNLGDDLLVGGAGKNTFFYTNGNGNDTIQGANNGDVVNLAQVTLEQIASSSITADAVTLNFKDGGSLQVNSAADVTYQLADGSKFSANRANLSWESK